MKVSGIYMIQSISKPERIYIGSAMDIRVRWNNHKKDLGKNKHHSFKLQSHINKYGIEDLEFSIIESGEYISKNHLLSREQGWFEPFRYKDTQIPYFNNILIAGSRLGTIASEETRQKLRDHSARRGNPAWSRGKVGVYSKETINNMSNSKKGKHYNVSAEFKVGTPPWNKGKKATPEAILHQSKAHKGQRGFWKNKKMSLEARQNMSKAGGKSTKPILQYDKSMNFIRGWGSATEVSQMLPILRNSISSCLIGNSKSAGGYIWKFKSDKI